MFHWLKKCFSQISTTGEFEKVHHRATYPDWKAPQSSDCFYILQTFKDQHPTITSKSAINSFFYALENLQVQKHEAFHLKHLFILDQAVDESLFLHMIGHYYNSHFTQEGRIVTEKLIDSRNKSIQSTSIQKFNYQYFKYIKKKAQSYQAQNIHDTNKKNRQAIIQKLSNENLFKLIQSCFSLQLQLIQLSQIYESLSAKQQKYSLLEEILIWLLKTQLFGYSIILLSMNSLFQNINQLELHCLIKLKKYIIEFNNHYIINFMNFVQKNKNLEGFKEIKYNQIISIQPNFYNLIDKLIDENQIVISSDDESNAQFPYNILLIQSTQYLPIKQHKPRSVIEIQPIFQNPYSFYNYQNNLSQIYKEQKEDRSSTQEGQNSPLSQKILKQNNIPDINEEIAQKMNLKRKFQTCYL